MKNGAIKNIMVNKLILILVLLCSASTFGQSKTPLTLQEINNQYDNIRGIKEWTKIIKSDNDSTKNAIGYQFFYHGDTLKKVTAHSHTDSTEISRTFYIINAEASVVHEIYKQVPAN